MFFRSDVGANSSSTVEPYLHLSPNPIRDFVTLSIHSELGLMRQVEIHSVTGSRLRQITNIDQTVFSFYLSGLPTGVYLLSNS